ncbi:hypothetical protein ACFQ1M_01510 [Sungkyunkwania multivorans]|uniref:Uncharacterized protein n=1 Tax=Sungkyunkwania multivorans TaxID=1173618 RepID=A0ABW3CSX9_9FLAO
MATINSKWAATPIDLSNSLSHESWSGAADVQMTIPGGFLWVKNDAQFMYAALDMVDDTTNNPGTGDYFWFTFDRNRNKAISPNFDVNYGLYPGNPNKMGRQYYLGPGSWTGLINEASLSECKQAFEASPNSTTPHRIWKFKFKLTDLNVSLLPFWWMSYVNFGLRVHSSAPNKNWDTPNNFYTNFTHLHRIYFSRKPSIAPSLSGPVMGSVGLIPTTQINSNTGKATTAAGYYVHVTDAAFGGLLNIIGNRTTMQNLYGSGARKYKMLHQKGKSGTFTEFESSWRNYRWIASQNKYVPLNYSPDSNNYYWMLNPSVDYSIDDLLLQFDSTALDTGFHQFKIEFYNTANVKIPTTAQTLTLYIDNNVPSVKIDAIKHGVSNVGACGIVNLTNNTDGVKVIYDAFDIEGNLRAYNLTAQWGEGHTAVIDSKSYTPSPTDSWQGQNNILAPSSGVWVPPVTCAYAFRVRAWARTTNGYGWVGHNSAVRYVTMIKP